MASTPAESLIGQFNRRVKGAEKSWGKGVAKAFLQGWDAQLSEDGSGEAFQAHRPGGR